MRYTIIFLSGYSQKQSEDISIAFTALIEVGILLSLTTRNSKPLDIIAEQVPLLLIKK